MSIEEKVVQLKFDNGQFESGVKTTLNTLTNLKEGLKMSGAGEALSGIGKVAAGFSFSGMADNIAEISGRFSSLGIIGITTLQNITNQAVNAGKTLLSSLTIDPIKSGFGEYELKMGAIQTIMAGTGETLDTVNSALADLNAYSDKTIYSFKDMTSNIGKFTNAGVSLKDSTSAIQGIANVAAISGANAEEASRAMYNFAQSLSSGAVKLLDWKSIENANMATVGFKTSLMDAAVAAGTLTKESDGLYKTIGAGTIVTATKGFNESLEQQWLTSDALVSTLGMYADATTEVGAKATAAAQDVKTMSQMLDTMKESVGSGWAQTWETVIGDKDQATKLFTGINNAFGNLIGPMTTARNEVLSFWATYGGRDALIQGVTDGFKFLGTVIKPIIEAFKEIFPAASGARLILITRKVADFIQSLRISGSTLDNLKSTAKGVFAILDIGKMIISKLLLVVFPLGNALGFVGKVFFAITAPIANFFSALDLALRSATGFSDFIIKMGGALSIPIPFIDQIVLAFKALRGGFDSVIEAFSQPITLGEKFKAAFSIIEKTFNQVGVILQAPNGMFGALMEVLDRVAASFTKVTDVFKSGLPFADKLSSAFAVVKSTFDGIVTSGSTAVSTGSKGFSDFFAGISISMQPLSDAISWIGDRLAVFKDGVVLFLSKLKGVFNTIGEFLAPTINSIKSAFEGADASSTADGLQKILGGGIIVAIIAGIKQLLDSFTGVGKGVEGLLKSITGVFDGVRTSLEKWQQNLQAKTILMIAGAVLMLTAAIVVLSALDPAKVAVGIAAITLLLAELFGFIAGYDKAMGKSSFASLTKVSVAMIALSIAVILLTSAFVKLGAMKPEEIVLASVALAAILAELSVASLLLSKSSGSLIKSSLGLIVFSLALRVLVEVVKAIGNINIEVLKQGLAGIGVLMAEVAAFMFVTGKASMSISSGIALLALSLALNMIAKLVVTMGAMDPAALMTGLVTIGLIMAELALFIKATGDEKGFIVVAIGALVLAEALKVLTGVISTFGNMPIPVLVQGGIAMGAVLTIIAGAMRLMPANMLVSAASLIVVGVALMLLTKSLIKMATMSWEDFGKSMAVLAGALVLIAGGMYLMTGALPGAAALLVVSAALWVLVPVLLILGSMSIQAVGIALLMLAGVFVILGIAGYALAPVVPIILLLSAALVLIGIGCMTAGVGLLYFSTGLAALAVSGAAGGAVIIAIITKLIDLIPLIAKKIGEGIVSFSKSIGEGALQIAASVGQVINAVLDIIAKLGPKIIQTIFNLLVSLLQTLATAVPQMVDAGMDLLLGILQGIADHIQDITETTIDIITAFIDGISAKLPEIIQSGVDLILSFINGLADAITLNTPAMITAIDRLFDAIIDAGLLVLETAPGKFQEKGKTIMESGFVQGIKDKLASFEATIRSIPAKAILWIGEKLSEFTEAGKNLIDGFINGISKGIETVKTTAANVATSALSAIKKALLERSPSKATELMGVNFDKGFINGMVSFAGVAANAAKDVGKNTISALSKAVSNISDVVTDNIDANPTIRPVLDLTAIETGSNKLDNMLNKTQTISVSGAIKNASMVATSMSTNGASIQNGSETPVQGNALSFTQNNYSPKALSRLELYRQTKNQFSAMKGMVGT